MQCSANNIDHNKIFSILRPEFYIIRNKRYTFTPLKHEYIQ